MRVHVDPVAGREFRSVTGSDPTWWRSRRVLEEPRPRYGTVAEEDLAEHQEVHGVDRVLGCSEYDAWCQPNSTCLKAQTIHVLGVALPLFGYFDHQV